MKQAIGTTSLFKIILVFTFLFAAFLSVAINYNKVYRMKNEALYIIEKYEGVTQTSIPIINNYLKNNGYNIQGNCGIDYPYGVKDLNSNDVEKSAPNTKYYYCLNEYCKNGACNVNKKGDNQIYFQAKFFFKFNLPFFEDLATFKITGETKGIKFYNETQRL